MLKFDINAWSRDLPNTPAMPVMFLGHGSPMNALEENEFTREWNAISNSLPILPTAILCISAHWLTPGKTAITAMQQPKTIYDFGGFPPELFAMQYPASGNQALVNETVQRIQSTHVEHDHSWGLDHGTWAVLCHIFPQADVPVVQLSIDYSQDAPYHYQLAQQLAGLRRKGVLIIASGNMVHNLKRMSFHSQDPYFGFDWALEADAKMQHFLHNHQHEALIQWEKQGTDFLLSIPTPDHYYPMLYALALQEEQDDLTIFNARTVAGSLSMTSFRLDQN